MDAFQEGEEALFGFGADPIIVHYRDPGVSGHPHDERLGGHVLGEGCGTPGGLDSPVLG